VELQRQQPVLAARVDLVQPEAPPVLVQPVDALERSLHQDQHAARA
jgi:hypothetical protein